MALDVRQMVRLGTTRLLAELIPPQHHENRMGLAILSLKGRDKGGGYEAFQKGNVFSPSLPKFHDALWV
jgi:hypothetical protein